MGAVIGAAANISYSRKAAHSSHNVQPKLCAPRAGLPMFGLTDHMGSAWTGKFRQCAQELELPALN